MDIFLALFLPNGVVDDLYFEYYLFRFSIQVSKYFDVTDLTLLLVFLFNCFACVNYFALSLLNFIVRNLFNCVTLIWNNFFASNHTLI